MTRQVRKTRRAENDLLDIWTWIAADDPAAADRLLDRLGDVLARLADQPRMGRSRSDLGAELRHFPLPPDVILYRIGRNASHVTRVIHGARRLDRLRR